MHGDLGRVEINKVTYPVIGDAAELGPLAQGANRWLATLREKPAGAEACDVREVGKGRCRQLRFHTLARV